MEDNDGVKFIFDIIGRDELGNRLFHESGESVAPSLWAGFESKYEEVFGHTIPAEKMADVKETSDSYEILGSGIDISVRQRAATRPRTITVQIVGGWWKVYVLEGGVDPYEISSDSFPTDAPGQSGERMLEVVAVYSQYGQGPAPAKYDWVYIATKGN